MSKHVTIHKEQLHCRQGNFSLTQNVFLSTLISFLIRYLLLKLLVSLFFPPRRDGGRGRGEREWCQNKLECWQQRKSHADQESVRQWQAHLTIPQSQKSLQLMQTLPLKFLPHVSSVINKTHSTVPPSQSSKFPEVAWRTSRQYHPPKIFSIHEANETGRHNGWIHKKMELGYLLSIKKTWDGKTGIVASLAIFNTHGNA